MENKNTEQEIDQEITEDLPSGKVLDATAENKNNQESEKQTEEKPKQVSSIPKKKKDSELIKEMENKLAELSDKHLRLQAEFDNYRKRTLKERAELIKTAGESVLVNILPVIDNFDRALNLMKEISENDPAKKGIILIYNQFRDFFKQNNLKEIEALNQDFDVDHHEAVTKIPALSEELKGKVVDVIQKGYMLNDKVIRFAKVVVGE